jgi:ABC-type nitrate/sulfonate/bicarbonate transport system permease component
VLAEQARHRVEYRSPLVWLWRRLVGAAFAMVMVSVGWYLIKVPDGLIGDDRLPHQHDVAGAFFELLVTDFAGADLGGHLSASLGRLVSGLAIGVVLGSFLGVAAGVVPWARTVVDPVVSFGRAVPPMAMAPFVLVWFGPGEATPVAVAAVAGLWVCAGAAGEIRIREVRAVGADLLYELTTGARSTVLTTWAAVLAVETLVSPIGLGPMIWSAQGRTDIVLVGVFTAGLVALAADVALRTLHYLSLGAATGWVGPSPRTPVPVDQAKTVTTAIEGPSARN